MEQEMLDQIWPIDVPTGLRPARGGNNLNRFVETPSATYMLRVYKNHKDPIRIRFELSILSQLDQMNLPFSVAAPIPTRSGELMAELPEGLATLTHALPGIMPERGNARHLRTSGEALGFLIRALADVRPEPEEGNMKPYGDLAGTHPLVPDPMAMVATLPVSPEKRERLSRLYQALEAEVPGIYGSLPWQIIHGDYARGNVLMADDRITGVIDFEFTLRDVRTMDLAIGLEAWSALSWEGTPEWDMLDAFGQGYASRQPLLAEEVQALPTLMRLRRGCTLIHYAGRFRQGLEPEEALAELADWVLLLEEWIEPNASELVRRARRWG